MAIKRAISVDQLLKKKFVIMEFENEWQTAFGSPERSGSWFIWGNSANGKTRFTLMLAKYLTKFGKVAYNTLEEGARRSFQRAIDETHMISVANKFIVLNKEPIEELRERLAKKKSPDIIIIDSVQYSKLSKAKYKDLLNDFPNKLFIFISHANGKLPKGQLADDIRYDADMKIWVEGFRAFNVGRHGGGDQFTIWEQGALKYWKS